MKSFRGGERDEGADQLLNGNLRYPAGALLLMHSGKVVHRVGKWTSMRQEDLPAWAKERGITPGRIGTVFMCPKDSYKKLSGKRPGWAAETAAGRLPDRGDRGVKDG